MENTVPPHTPQDKTFIYVLIDPETNEIRYVGKTTMDIQARMYKHLSDKAKTHKVYWIQSLVKRGLKPTIQVVDEFPSELWRERECHWIEFYRNQGCDLTNTSPGGLGPESLTPEIRAKIAASKRGQKLSPESIAKRSASVRARTEKRRPPSPETIEKLRKANLGKTTSPEQRAKISAVHKGRVKSPEECQHIAEAKTGKKRKPFTEEARRNMGNASRTRKHAPHSAETRRKISEVQRGKKRGPYSAERRANIAAGIRRARAMKKFPPDANTP